MNTPTAQSIFLDAIENHPPADWPAHVAAACGEDQDLARKVLRLLEAHSQVDQFMTEPASGINDAAQAVLDQSAAEPLGTMIGPYKLLEQLGEGGMGIVYVAEQTEPVRRQVALKIIKPGMDSRQVIARFEAERQSLAVMDHPNIARILDAGTVGEGDRGQESGVRGHESPHLTPDSRLLTPGSSRPYFVMELVRGLPITEYCDQAQLDIRSRLALFHTVCQAVQHAHQKGIIHRDLKPGNVLITLHDPGAPGVPKIIDFGVAKAISPDRADLTAVTSIFQLIGTPLYMSPEQAELGNRDIDTRSDVYSLGVLLYELLTGQTPFDKETLSKASFDEMRRIIREEEPLRLSQRFSKLDADLRFIVAQKRGVEERRLSKSLRGELDWIVMRALEKDRNRRYESASALAADVQRYLDDKPVDAVPPSSLYLARKFVRRHSLGAAIGGLTVSLLAIGIAATGWQAFRATKAELSGEQRYEIAKEAVDKYLLEVTSDEQLASPAFQDLRLRLLEAAEPFLERLSQDRPADLRGRAQQAAVLHSLGQLHAEIGKNSLAHQALEQSAEIYEQLSRDDPQSSAHQLALAKVTLSQGDLWRRQGEDGKAISSYQRSLEMRKPLHSAAPSDSDLRYALAEGQLRLGTVQWGEEGRRNLSEAIHTLTELLVEQPEVNKYQESLARAHQRLAFQLEAIAPDAACRNHELAIGAFTQLVAQNNGSARFQIILAGATAHLGDTYYRLSRMEESRQCRQQAVDQLQRLVEQHSGRVDVETQLARVLHLLAENEEELWLSAGPGSGLTLDSIEQRYQAALRIDHQHLAQFPQVVDFQVQLAATQAKLGEVLAFRGQTAEAIRLLQNSRREMERVQAETGGHATARRWLPEIHAMLWGINAREGRQNEARQEWVQAKAFGFNEKEHTIRSARIRRRLAIMSAEEGFREVLRQTGGFIATMSGDICSFQLSHRNLLFFQDENMKSLLSSFRFPRLDRKLISSLGSRVRRLMLETLEDRSLMAGITVAISDASAIEGNTALKYLDQFVAEGSGGLLTPRNGVFGPDANGDGAQDFYVPSANTDQVLRYDGINGSFIGEFVSAGSGGLNGPAGLAFGLDGNLYVASNESNALLRYSGQTGAFIDQLASGLAKPLGLTIAPDGSVLVANQDSDEILRYKDGTLSAFVPVGSGGLDRPRNAVYGPDGNGDGVSDLYVSSHDTRQVLRYDGSTGSFIGVFASTPAALAFGPNWIEFGSDGYLYASARNTTADFQASIVRYDANTGALVDILATGFEGWSITVGPDNIIYNSSNSPQNFVDRFGASSLEVFQVSLSSPSPVPVSVSYSMTNGTATAGSDYVSASGTLTFSPGQTRQSILVKTVDNATIEPNETFNVILANAVGAVIGDGTGVGTIIDNDTKFYVVDDATANRTFEYGSGTGTAGENYALNAGNSAPRGAASTAAGDKVWTVDANKNVYVYNNGGGLLGAWAAGSLAANAAVEGITTNGTDVWIVDAKQDKVFRYTSAASRVSGSQNAASSFNLASGNADPKDLVTDGASIWVVNDAGTDKVFKYNLAGTLLGSWTISTSGASAPTGITLDPSSPSHLWIVDSGSDRVYQYDAAANRTSGSQAASTSFALAAGNSNPQGIADPPVGTPASAPVAAAPSVAGVLVTSGTGQASASTSDAKLPIASPLCSTVAANGPSLVADGRGLKAAPSPADVRATADRHDEALSSIADELESLLPGRKLRR